MSDGTWREALINNLEAAATDTVQIKIPKDRINEDMFTKKQTWESLVKCLDELEILDKKLEVAVDALGKIESSAYVNYQEYQEIARETLNGLLK